MTSRDWRFRIALNCDELPLLVIDELPAADSAVGADRTSDVGPLDFGLKCAGAFRHRLGASSISARAQLLKQRPAGEKVYQHGIILREGKVILSSSLDMHLLDVYQNRGAPSIQWSIQFAFTEFSIRMHGASGLKAGMT